MEGEKRQEKYVEENEVLMKFGKVRADIAVRDSRSISAITLREWHPF